MKHHAPPFAMPPGPRSHPGLHPGLHPAPTPGAALLAQDLAGRVAALSAAQSGAQSGAPGTGPARITRLEHAGAVWWVKRAERPSLRMRLQKGDPRRAFARERAALHQLHALGAMVPPIVAEGPDFFVLPDCGPALTQFVARAHLPEGQRAFAAAGRSLAQLHRLGQRHGRPSLRDICWNGDVAVLLDFERGLPRTTTLRAQAMDLLILIHSACTLDPDADAALRALQGGYLDGSDEDAPAPPGTQAGDTLAGGALKGGALKGGDPLAIWARARLLAQRLRWLGPLSHPLRRREARAFPPKHKREWAAIPATLAFFAQAEAAQPAADAGTGIARPHGSGGSVGRHAPARAPRAGTVPGNGGGNGNAPAAWSSINDAGRGRA